MTDLELFLTCAFVVMAALFGLSIWHRRNIAASVADSLVILTEAKAQKLAEAMIKESKEVIDDLQTRLRAERYKLEMYRAGKQNETTLFYVYGEDVYHEDIAITVLEEPLLAEARQIRVLDTVLVDITYGIQNHYTNELKKECEELFNELWRSECQ